MEEEETGAGADPEATHREPKPPVLEVRIQSDPSAPHRGATVFWWPQCRRDGGSPRRISRDREARVARGADLAPSGDSLPCARMTPDRWRRVKELLYASLELPQEERTGFVHAQSAGDEELAQEVEWLLTQQTDGFLSSPPDQTEQRFAQGLRELEPETPLIPGQLLSHYKIESEISRGGMGVVYRAIDATLNRSVALKVLPSGVFIDQERKDRFLIEAQAAAALHDPRVATVFEMGAVDGVTFIAMELIEGESLAETIARGPLPLMRTLEIAIEVASALALAHGKGIVHRDLKLSNIMLTTDGQPKIIDFGLAKLVAHPSRVSADGPTTKNPLSASDGECALKDLTIDGRVMGTRATANSSSAAATTEARCQIKTSGFASAAVTTSPRSKARSAAGCT